MNPFATLTDSGLRYMIRALEVKLVGLDPAHSRHSAIMHAELRDRLLKARDEQARRSGVACVPISGRPSRRRGS